MAGTHAQIRPKITLESTAGTGFRYVTTKNRRSTPDRLVIRTYDPVVRPRRLQGDPLMAKKSLIAADARRRRIVARYAARRAELKEIARVGAGAQERADARAALAALPRDASPTRLVSRDVVDGRPRAVYAKFGLSRVRFRQMAHDGQLPGVTKSSW